MPVTLEILSGPQTGRRVDLKPGQVLRVGRHESGGFPVGGVG